MKLTYLVLTLPILAGALAMQGCAEKAFTKGEYDDPNRVQLLDDKFNEADMQQMAETIVNAMVACPEIKDARKPPMVAVSKVKVVADEFIEIGSLNAMIRTQLSKSRKVRFIDRSTRGEVDDELEYGKSGRVSKDTQKSGGKQIAIDYLMNGELNTNVQQVGPDKFVYYKLTMNLVNTDTTVIDCTEEKEIRKKFKKQSVGL